HQANRIRPAATISSSKRAPASTSLRPRKSSLSWRWFVSQTSSHGHRHTGLLAESSKIRSKTPFRFPSSLVEQPTLVTRSPTLVYTEPCSLTVLSLHPNPCCCC